MPDALTFASSEPLTIGIEEEFFLHPHDPDAAPETAARADELLDGGWDVVASPGGWFKPELLRCSIELATAASADLEQLDVDLCALRAELAARADALGLDLVALGMHPTLRATPALVSPSPDHQAIRELHERVGTLAEQVTHGMHVHVGMPDLDAAVRVTDALAGVVPLLVALTANSPVAAGAPVPWSSARSETLRRLLWGGPTPRIATTEEYRTVHALVQLENPRPQRFLWDVAPVPALGTVEVRALDVSADPARSLGVAALIQGLAAHVLDGGALPRPSETLERHNRWSAFEFGMRARFLVEGCEQPVDVARQLEDALELARPHARQLGSELWLDLLAGELVEESPADAARRAWDAGGVGALMQQARVAPADA